MLEELNEIKQNQADLEEPSVRQLSDIFAEMKFGREHARFVEKEYGNRNYKGQLKDGNKHGNGKFV